MSSRDRSAMSPFAPQHNAYSASGRPSAAPYMPVRPSPLSSSGDASYAEHFHKELDDTSSVTTMNCDESVYERAHLLHQQSSVSSFNSTTSHARMLSDSAVPNEYEHIEYGKGQGSGVSNGRQPPIRRKSEDPTHLNHRKPRILVDSVDQLDITTALYGAGLFHHESPYDCALPQRSSSADAPVHAFECADVPERTMSLRPETSNFMTPSAPYPGTAPGIHHHSMIAASYRDSFLEGSPAYGAEGRAFARQQNRKSFFKRISTVGAKIGVGGTRRL